MVAKMGRPPVENPKDERITVRIDKETSEILRKCCEKEHVDKAEAVRRGIKKLGK